MNLILKMLFWIVLFLIIYTYLFYFWILKLLSLIYGKIRKKDDTYRPSVSFLIAAYNEKKVINDKIQNCLSLKYPKNKIEFLFGSDHSTDGTNQIIKKYSGKHRQIGLIPFNVREGKSAVINKIVPKAKGEILIFSDANTLYQSDSVQKMASHFVDPQIGGVCGKLILIKPNQNVGGVGESLYWDYENRIKYLEGKIKTVFGATGGIYAIRKRLFYKLPEHKTNISDDFLIPLKIVEQGWDFIYDRQAIAHENASLNMHDEFSRKVRIGSANAYAIGKIKALLSPTRGFVAFGLWSHKIIRWAVPLFMIALFFTNLFLLGSPFYLLLFMAQVALYFLALSGWWLDHLGIQNRLFSVFYYAVSINLALLVGYYKYVTGTIRPTWSRLER